MNGKRECIRQTAERLPFAVKIAARRDVLFTEDPSGNLTIGMHYCHREYQFVLHVEDASQFLLVCLVYCG